MVINTINEEMSFCDYYSQWVDVYKEGAIREVTMKKYKLTQAWLRKLIPDLKLSEFDRVSYQKLINGYAEHHEHQTTMDLHHQLKGAILDAVDDVVAAAAGEGWRECRAAAAPREAELLALAGDMCH